MLAGRVAEHLHDQKEHLPTADSSLFNPLHFHCFFDQSCVMQGTAIAAVLAGRLAGHLRDQKGWNALRVRTFCQDVATLGRFSNHM